MAHLGIAAVLFLLTIFTEFTFAADSAPDTVRAKELIVEAPRTPTHSIDTIAASRSAWEQPGLSIRNGNTPGDLVTIGVLGGAPTATKVYLNGVDIADPRTGIADLSTLPDWEFDQAEWLSGGSTTAMGGQLLANTSVAMDRSNVRLYSRGGNENGLAESILLQSRIGHGFGVSFSHADKPRGAYPKVDDVRRDRFASSYKNSLYTTFQIISKVTATAQYLNRSRDLPGLVGRAIESETNDYYELTRFGLQIHSYGLWSLMYSTDWNRYNRPAQQHSPNGYVPFIPFRLVSRSQVSTVAWSNSLEIDSSSRLLFTSDLRSEAVQTHDLLNRYSGQSWDADRILTRGRLEHHRRFYWKIPVQMVVSVENLSKITDQHESVQSFTLRASELSTVFSHGMYGKCSVGQGLRWPALTDLYLAPTVYAAGNPDLLPERSVSVQGEFGWRSQKSQSNASLMLYRRWVKDGIVWQPGLLNQYVPRNQSNILSMGGVCQVHWVLLPTLHAQLQFSRTASYNDTPNDPQRGNLIPLVPEYQARSSLRWTNLPERAVGSWEVVGYYQSRRYAIASNTDVGGLDGNEMSDELTIDVYNSHTIRTKRFGTWDWQVQVLNIFDRRRWAIEYVPLSGREYVLSLTYRYDWSEEK